MLRPDQQEVVMGITGSKTIDATWAEIESLLVSRLAAVEREIRQYPAPIPACDAQFNHLLEERSGIPQEMVRAGIAAEVSKSLPERQRALDEFIAASAYVDGINPHFPDRN
jgi:hypothetical protein